MHSDHAEGADLFPKAQIWIQKTEYDQTVDASEKMASKDGRPLPDYVAALKTLKGQGRVHLVDGDAKALLPGVTVDPGKIARSLVLLMLLPLAAGLVLKARRGDLAARVKPLLDRISNLSLILLLVLITAANIQKVVQVFGSRAILAGILFIALGFGIGWLLGGPGADTRRVVALGTAQRNIAAALVVASESFDPKVIVMVTVVAIGSLIILMPLSGSLATRGRSG